MVTIMFAAIVLNPASLAAWVVVGLVSAWLACTLMEPPTYGVPGELVLGGVGGLAGGFIFGLFGGSDPSFWMSMAVALAVAVVLIGGARVMAARSEA